MALTLEAANKVRQKTRMLNLDPGVFYGLKSFFLYWNQFRSNETLQFVPFSGAEVAADDGNADKVIADAACKIYVFYGKKRNTATATWFKGQDHASTATPTDPTFLLEFNAANQIAFEVYPAGYAQSAGWTIEQSTDDITGSTRTNAADSVDGFYIIGAA